MIKSRNSDSVWRWILTLVLFNLMINFEKTDAQDLSDFYHNPSQSSYARVQYAHDKANNTRRYNIQRDPTIQYVSFDELYNKYMNDQNPNSGSTNTKNNGDTVILGSSQMSSVSVTTSDRQEDKTQRPMNPVVNSETNENSNVPVDGIRRWEDVPDLTNGWTVERNTPTTTSTVRTTTSTESIPKTFAYNDKPSSTYNAGVDHMYAFSTAYQNYESDKFNKVSVDRDGTLPSSTTTTEHNYVPSTTTVSSTTNKATVNDNFIGSSAEYAHAIGEKNYGSSVVDQTSSTHQPVVMEASWTEPRPTSPKTTVTRTQTSEIQDRADVNPSNIVTVSVQGPQGFSLADDGVQSAWRPFMGPTVPQTNSKITKGIQIQQVSTSAMTTTTSPTSTVRVDRTTAGTLFYNDATDRAVTSGVRFTDNGNNGQPKRRPQIQQFNNIPNGQPSQQGAIQILMIPNMDENEIKVSGQPFPPTGGNQIPPGMRFQQERPSGFQLNPNGQPMFTNQQPQQNQNGPQRPLQFGRPNETNEQRPPQFGQQVNENERPPQPQPPFGQQVNENERPPQPPFGQQVNENERPPQPQPPFGQQGPGIRPLQFAPQNQQGDQRPLQLTPFQRPPPFMPPNNNRPQLPQTGPFQPNRDLMRPDGPPPPFDRFTTAASNNEGNFISGIPNSQGPNRIPSGPVGLPPQLIPHVQAGRPTNPPNQGSSSINIPLPVPRPTGVIGTSIDNPLPGPPIPLPGIPSGPIVIGNLPNGNNNNNNDDRKGPNGSFRPNFQPPVIPDRIDNPQNHENFIQQQPPQGLGVGGPFGGQMDPNMPPPNFRPQNFPPRGPPPQATSSPSLLKSIFSKFFPFARSLNLDNVESNNETTLVIDPSIYESIARSAENSSEPYVINIGSFPMDFENVTAVASNVTIPLSTTEVVLTKETDSTVTQSSTNQETTTSVETTNTTENKQ